mmetsp:Transcript_2808/g.6719  ORF Transcript_2808/g.6719 Transcript_2808/m.6719 type:complete len:232 (-) Transcript_2808:120-815(-)
MWRGWLQHGDADEERTHHDVPQDRSQEQHVAPIHRYEFHLAFVHAAQKASNLKAAPQAIEVFGRPQYQHLLRSHHEGSKSENTLLLCFGIKLIDAQLVEEYHEGSRKKDPNPLPEAKYPDIREEGEGHSPQLIWQPAADSQQAHGKADDQRCQGSRRGVEEDQQSDQLQESRGSPVMAQKVIKVFHCLADLAHVSEKRFLGTAPMPAPPTESHMQWSATCQFLPDVLWVDG